MEKNYYIKILEWAYEKHQEGFTLNELKHALDVTDKEWEWWKTVFITTSENDRKLIELFQTSENSEEKKYTLNDKGMLAVVNYRELKQARDESKKANTRAILSALLAVATLAIGIWTASITQESLKLTEEKLEKTDAGLQLSIDPQIKIYLEQIDEDENFYTYNLGIENNGVIPYVNLGGKFTAVSVNDELGSFGLIFKEQLSFERKNESISIARVSVSKIGITKTKALVFDIEYQRNIDGKQYGIRPVFIIDDSKVYLPEQAKTVKHLTGTVQRLNEYTAPIMKEKVYWQEL